MKIFLLIFFVIIISCTQREELITQNEEIPINVSNNDLKIISPKYGETWKPGTTQKIKWELSSEVKKVQLIIYKKENLIQHLAISYPNIGEFNWNIPNNFVNSVHYRIKIIAVDVPRIFSLSDYFYIKDDYNTTND